MSELTITVLGTPKPKGSLRHVGHGRLVEQVNDKGWRAAVTVAAAQQRDRHGWQTLTGVPVVITIRCIIPRPKSVRRAFPITRSSGDADKLARLVLDALTDAQIIADDAQVVDLRITKEYHPVHGPVDTQPGARIHVAEVVDNPVGQLRSTRGGKI